jgi:hypothetical protein
MGMSIWDQLKWGFGLGWNAVLKPMATAALAIGAGFMEGGPAGAAMAGIPAVIGAVSDSAHRISGYLHEVNDDGTANAATVKGIVNPTKHVNVLNQALGAVGMGSPDTTNDIATQAAKFFDGITKYGDATAAAKFAGATPIGKHISSAISGAVVNYAKSKIGFDAHNAMRFGPGAMREAQMLPSTSAYAGPVRDYMMNGGAEALAMRKLTDYGSLNRSRDITFGSGSA